jgi:hypothetical protein
MCLDGIQKPDTDSVTLNMVTQTPLYTGGIGQWGDQIHPSGLLGSIRHFSCLVARTLGDASFEPAVWGKVGAGQNETHAKQVGLRWELGNGEMIDLPSTIKVRTNESHRGWFFNKAYKGRALLTVTPRGMAPEHWNILLLSLRIQIRYGTFGAKDQFGLGVLACENINNIPLASADYFQAISNANRETAIAGPSLKDAIFVKINMGTALVTADWKDKLESSLTLRSDFRDRFRTGFGNDTDKIRHYLCGYIERSFGFGSGINISAPYPVQDMNKNKYAQARIFLLSPHTGLPDRSQYKTVAEFDRVSQHFNLALSNQAKIFDTFKDWVNAKTNFGIKQYDPPNSIGSWLAELAK